jgi:hypothetical protein
VRKASATGRDRPLVHSGYTRSRQVGECNGHERSRPVTRNHRSENQRSRYQAAYEEAGQSSSLPTRLPRALRALANDAVVTRDGPHPAAELEPSPPGARSRLVPAVPPTCHKQRSPAVSSGQPRSLRRGRWAGRPSLTWGGGGGRNCMACKRSSRATARLGTRLRAGRPHEQLPAQAAPQPVLGGWPE